MSIYTLGIDVGSTASKCVILKDGKEIVAKSLVDVGTGTSGPARSISEVLENAHMKKEDMAYTWLPATAATPWKHCRQADERTELPCYGRLLHLA